MSLNQGGVHIKITEKELNSRKERIIHTAFRLFCQRGIDGVSIRDIACGAQVGEKSIYRYFTSKTELTIATVSVLWKEIVYELIASIDHSQYESKNGLAQIECLLGCFTNLYKEYSQYVLLSYDYKLFLIRHEAFLTESKYFDEIKPIQAMYLKALKKGMEDGSIEYHSDLQELYHAIWGLIRGYIVKMVIYNRMYEGTNMWIDSFDCACQLVLNGLRPRNNSR